MASTQLQIGELDVSGYRPEELKADVVGDELMIVGEHMEQNDSEAVHESVERQFVRRVKIPEGIKPNSIKFDLNSKGCLCIMGMKQSLPESEKQQAIQQGGPNQDYSGIIQNMNK